MGKKIQMRGYKKYFMPDFNNNECLYLVADILCDNFEKMRSHFNFYKGEISNTALFFSTVEKLYSAKFENIIIKKQGFNVNDKYVFFEWNTGNKNELTDNYLFDNKDIFSYFNIPFVKDPKINIGYLLYYDKENISNAPGNALIGIYYPEINFLFASDWSHDRNSAQFLELILPEIKTIFKELVREPREIKNVKITLGGDPEFELFNDRGVISAERIISTISHEYESIGHECGSIGIDGSGAQLELRPNPGSPEEVVDNIKNLLTIAHKTLKNYNISVKGDHFSLGGHIHVGAKVDDQIIKNPNIIKYIDDFLGIFCCLNGSARGDYAKRMAYEYKPHGFEYRTIPSAYLYDPKLTYIIYKLVHNLVKNYIYNSTLEYNDPPSEKDYISLGELNKEELDYMYSMIETIKTSRDELFISRWIEPIYTNCLIEILFNNRDSFLYEIKQTLEDELIKIYTIPNKVIPTPITIFGFKNSRGLVSNIKIEGFELIEYDNYRNIGLPYSVRMNIEEFNKYKENIIKGITNHINSYLLGFFNIFL